MQPQTPPSAPEPFAVPPAVGQPQPSGALQGAPQTADDGDRIEKDWIDKIKHLLHSTKQDPYQQSKQFSELKADYLQKRYGKTVQIKD